jgi:membrane-bound ClpP family serine protease
MHLMMIIMALPLLGIVFFFLFPFPESLIYYLSALAFSAFFYFLMFKVMRKPPVMGREAMVGSTAEVLSWENGSGTVSFHGEIWKARTKDHSNLTRGTKVKITGLKGLILMVSPFHSSVGED